MEGELRFNLLGKIIYIKENLLNDWACLKEFYDVNRGEYIVDISPGIFESILQYYKTRDLSIPANIQMEYFKEILKKFRIDTSVLDRDLRCERRIPWRKSFRIIHILFEYADCRSRVENQGFFALFLVCLACQLAQILHYLCSMIALLSCAIISLSLTFVDSTADLPRANQTERNFVTPSSKIFILDLFFLVWAMGESILRIITTPSLYRYLTTLGFFDLMGKRQDRM